MKRFEVGKEYTGKTFFGNVIRYRVIKRTAKTITVLDVYGNEEITKRIKGLGGDEYIEFSKDYMGFCPMKVRA